jgi:opacity protein-like surface antigen
VKRLKFAAAGAAMICAALCASAQQAPSVDRILARYVAALGGRDAIMKQTSRHVKGTIEVAGLDGHGTAESFAKAPDKYMATISFPGIGENKRGYDGTTGWASAGADIRELTGEELSSMARAADMYQALDIQKNYPKLTFAGTDDIGGRPAYELDGDPGDGTMRKMYFDTTSGLMVRNVESLTDSGQTTSTLTDIRDYREASGVQYPYTLMQRTTGPDGSITALTIRIAQVETNVPIDDAQFTKPQG